MPPEAKGLYPALLAVQSEAPTLQKTAINPHFKSRFVPLDKVHEVVMPLLNKHGLTWVTLPGHSSVDGAPLLDYALIHVESGEKLQGSMALLPAKSDPQGQGSAITYARRYSLMAVLGLVADEDDDGNAGSKPAVTKTKSGGYTAPTVKPTVADQVAALPGTVELLGKAGAEPIKTLRADVGISSASLKAHVVGTHGKDSLEDLTLDEGKMVTLWLEQKKAA